MPILNEPKRQTFTICLLLSIESAASSKTRFYHAARVTLRVICRVLVFRHLEMAKGDIHSIKGILEGKNDS